MAFLPILSLALSAAGSAYSALQSAKAKKENDRQLEELRKYNDNEYLRDYYKGLGSQENRAYIKQLDNRMKKADTAAENSNVATNATHEQALATKQRNNEVYDDAIAGMAARSSVQAERARDNWFNRNYSIAAQQANNNNQSAANWMNAASGLAQAGTSLGMTYAMDGGSLLGKPGAGNPNLQAPKMPKINTTVTPGTTQKQILDSQLRNYFGR